jgi:lipopolysaccharide export system protein LptA
MKKIFLIFLLMTLNGPSFAAAVTAAAQPVEISAAKSLEWNRKEKTYTAREKVVVVQGAAKIQSDILVARYTDDAGMTDFTTLEASQHVVIQSPPYTATGDRAVYNVKAGTIALTGKAIVTHEADTLTADVLTIYLDRDSGGKLAARKITASGNVTVKTAKETITGDTGVYDVPAQKSVLSGKVMIRQGENWLEGTTANIDMTTGISQLLGGSGAGNDGRVKGVFYPKDREQTTEGQKN